MEAASASIRGEKSIDFSSRLLISTSYLDFSSRLLISAPVGVSLEHQMYRGSDPAVSTRTYKKYVPPVTVAHGRESKLRIASTHPLDGHPEVRFKRGIVASDIYPLSDYSYEDREQDIMEIRVVKFLPAVKSEEEVDWNSLESYNVAKLTDMARARGLIISSSDKKADLIDLLREWKEGRDR